MTGHIELITGGMFAGKTEELVRRVRRAQFARQKVQVFTTLWSDPCQIGNSSHGGMRLDASPVHWPSEVPEAVKAVTNVVAIDEVQFFGGGIVGVCETLADNGKRIIQIMQQVAQVLAPGAVAIWVLGGFVRNWEYVDFPGQWRQLGEACGFESLEWVRAWKVESRGAQYTLEGELEERILEKKSLFRRMSEKRGSPPVDFEVVLIQRRL